MDLLEREHFLRELDAILNDVANGSGRFVLISGEAGIGKTSLVENFTKAHNRVLWGACDSLFTPRPLGPLYDIAHQMRGNLLAVLEEGAPRNSIFSAFLDELENQQQSLVVIEDVHWADESTLDLLKFLGRRINRIKCMLIVTYRDDEVGADHPLRRVIGDLPHRSVARIRLPPLSEKAVKQMAEQAGRHIEDLHTVTGGNPFFVTEALATKEPGVPVTVSDAVLSRATRFSPAAREALELVSIVPTKTEMWLINDTIHPTTSALEECISGGMLLSDGEALAFRHELARRATEDSLAAPRRQRWHALVLKALLNNRSEALLARIVHHAAQARDEGAVLEFAPLAALQASVLSAHREAASHYYTALKFGRNLAPKRRARILECRSYECYLNGQLAEALEARTEALRVWKGIGDQLREGDNLRWMSRLTWGAGHRKEAENYGAQAVTILENLPPGQELAMAYSNRAQLHMLAQQLEDAVSWGSRAVDLAQKLGATETLVHALNNVGTAELFACNDQGRLKLEESLQLALANDLHHHAARAYTNLASVTVKNRRYDLAVDYLEKGIAHSTEYDLFYKLHLLASRARLHFEKGDWDQAADDASFVVGQSRVAAVTKISALAVLGHLRVRRGDPDAAGLLTEAHNLAIENGELQSVGPVASASAELAWLKGDRQQLIAGAQAVLQMAREHHDQWIQDEFEFWLWRADSPPLGPQVTGTTPYSLQRSGDWRAAAAVWKEIGCPYEEAIALADGDEASQRRALELLEKLGAGPSAEMVRQALRARGVRGIPRGPRPSTKENPAGLTSRQIEVLALIVDGLSNADIAKRLFISARTVDHHVEAILAKLNARSRAEAVYIALQSSLIPK